MGGDGDKLFGVTDRDVEEEIDGADNSHRELMSGER